MAAITTPVWRDDIFDDPDAVIEWLQRAASFSVIDETFNVAAVPDLMRQVLRTEVERMMPVVYHGLCFARCSTATVDTGARIHSDHGMGATHAWVWYSQDPPEDPDPTGGTLHGTAFFTHKVFGERVQGTTEEHERILVEEAMDESRWTVRQIAPMKRNRLVVYPADLFHSRYPHDGWGASARNGRVVVVGFCVASDHPDAAYFQPGAMLESAANGKEMDSGRN